MAVAVAPVEAVRVTGAVLGAADAVGLRRQQRVDERAEQLPHQIRAGLGQLLVQEHGGVDTGVRGHRDAPFESAVRGSLEGSRGDRTYIQQGRATGVVVHQRYGLNSAALLRLYPKALDGVA